MKEQFKEWFEVVYRDNPDAVNEIVSIWQDMVDDDEATWSGDEIFTDFLLHNELGDGSHFFAIDWKDADTLIDYLDDVAERFDFEFQWTDENREQDSVENLLPLAVAQLDKHDVLFYSLETGGDLYYFVAIPDVYQQDFERVSQQWGVEYTLL